ncbi:apiosidase-like domain-containing protein [Paenibacillus mendelii]|uniref:DUF4038 domain-containing protein n=1 Tax=Paenibacillus mendelii TaxID=206163 RepID=A0ABV6JIR3_9BACL|nr:DUF4038 domain-containing protein [Paenibacillus mendelii]MCQ6558739.1 DUF4038 domain-containing protein [Paenibacillus mendelii]
MKLADTEQWRSLEFTLSSAAVYENPFMDVDVTAFFNGPEGIRLARQAFWDGGNEWKVRFAPPAIGEWTVIVECSDETNQALNISEPIAFNCIAYRGLLEIYKHGFLRICDHHRYFTYDDGTPFFYLGDTHWFLPSEDFNASNVDGIDSQFKYMVDHRVSQGFTVYQSEPLLTTGNYLDVTHGIKQDSLALLQDLDRKFQYIADSGLVHANATLTFTSFLSTTDAALLRKLGAYWQARYGAYPVLWTTAQEVDPNFYNQIDPQHWKIIAQSIYDHDCYKHPLTAHMEFNAVSGWGGEYCHSWHALQPLDLSKDYFESFWHAETVKPYIAYEVRYEFNNQPTASARTSAYRAFQCGSFGFGYGVQGVWALNNSPDDWFHYGPYYRWFDGLNAAGGSQMTYFKQFYSTLKWWRLTPRFKDIRYGDFTDNNHAFLMTDDSKIYTAYFTSTSLSTGTLKEMEDSRYKAHWYNTRTGEYTLISNAIQPHNGEWPIPDKPDRFDWMLLVVTDETKLAPKLVVSSPNQATTIFTRYGTMAMSAAVNPGGMGAEPQWSVTNLDGTPTELAIIDSCGLLTAMGNGKVRVNAIGDAGKLTATKMILMARQDNHAPPSIVRSIQIKREEHQFVTEFNPSDTRDQRILWSVFEEDGITATDKAVISPYGVISCMKEGAVKIAAATMDGSGLTAFYDYVIPGYRDIVNNPMLVGAEVTASSTDYINNYRPAGVITGNYGNWAGWSSRIPEDDSEILSYDRPEWLQITFRETTAINHVELYTTGTGVQLRDFDMESWDGDEWTILATIRDNLLTTVVMRFPVIKIRALRVNCYKGDMMGIARISAIEVYLDE